MGFHTKYDVQFPRLLVHPEPIQKQHMGVSKNGGFSPQIIHGLIGFSIIFTIHFGVSLFLETSISNHGFILGFPDNTPPG